jgi:membrane protein DedA with SNARE-associated domain
VSAGTTPAHPARIHLAWLLAPIALMVVAGYTADALWPSLVESNPLLLIALSAKNRYLVLVVNSLPAWEYYVVGTLRLLLPDPFFFILGWMYGEAALHWMERRTPTVGRIMRTLERWFGRWGAPLVVLFPNNYVCAIAGAARMSPLRFAVLNVIGTIGRLVMIAVIGDVFAGPIDSILDFIAEWRIQLLAVTVSLVVLSWVLELRNGRREINALRELEDAADEIEAAALDPAEDPAAD